MDTSAPWYGLVGAGGFGAIVGWYTYFVNRYRKGDVQLGDLATVVGVIGGAAITTLFPAKGDLFAAYGIGLLLGFFGYFAVLVYLVKQSPNFNQDWFLDGRRNQLAPNQYIPAEIQQTVRAMTIPAIGASESVPPQSLQTLTALSLNENARNITKICCDRWGSNQNNCSAFVSAVASDLSLSLAGNADAIVAAINKAPWRQLGDGIAAQQAAQSGDLVIGGLTSTEIGDSNGHVVVVIDGPLANGKYPSAYWGKLGGTGGISFPSTINYAFRGAVRDSVHYAAIAV